MLADTTYWNFLDIRMMEAMATASMIPAAQETIKNFKKVYYNMTLKEAAPYFPLLPVKPNHCELHEILDRDPSQMTIGELHKHRFYLETEILKTGPDTCTICRIMIGSVAIVWQIHVDHVYQAYSRLKKLHPQLSLQAINYMSIPEMKRWVGLPFLFRGQEIGEIGPIETLSSVRHKPYPLPPGFEWSVLNSSNFDEVIQLFADTNFSLSKSYFEWFISCPQFKKGCFLGIRLCSSKKLMSFTLCTPYNIRVGGKLLSMVVLQQLVGQDAVEQQYQLKNIGTKETMRMLRFEGVHQAVIFATYCAIPKPTITYNVYTYTSYLHSLPYTSPRTVGLRRMKASDVPKTLTLTNQYTSQFDIGQVFISEKEFSHWFLSPLVTTYVVEESHTGNITDMFSFTNCEMITLRPSEKVAHVIALVITKSSAEQLITDMLVCAKQQKVTKVISPRFGLKENLFKNFEWCMEGECYFYNYKYPEVNDDNHCLFSIYTS